jgi:hypothetical protein
MIANRSKIIGITISIIALALLVIEKFGSLKLSGKISPLQTEGILRFIMLIGLIIIANSKEKTESQKVKQVRTNAFRFSFLILQCVLLGYGASVVLYRPVLFNGIDIFQIASVGLVFYLTTFYAGIFFDYFWQSYEEGSSLVQNKRKNALDPVNYLTVGIISLLMLVILILI